MKKATVCKGCKYLITHCSYGMFKGTCSYMDKTGHSRLVVEIENGGYQEDSCICYCPKEQKRRKKS